MEANWLYHVAESSAAISKVQDKGRISEWPWTLKGLSCMIVTERLM